MVIDHSGYAVSASEGDHTLIASDDFIKSDVILGSKKIEASAILTHSLAALCTVMFKALTLLFLHYCLNPWSCVFLLSFCLICHLFWKGKGVGRIVALHDSIYVFFIPIWELLSTNSGLDNIVCYVIGKCFLLTIMFFTDFFIACNRLRYFSRGLGIH